MSESFAVCSEQILDGKWESWCRLCAKADADYINVVAVQSEKLMNGASLKYHADLTNIILEIFRIHIKDDDKLPQIICKECHKVVLSLIKFSERVNKVQQMYDDLQNSINNSTTNLQMLLENYGLYKDELLMPQNGTELSGEEIFVADLEDTTIPTSANIDLKDDKVATIEQPVEKIKQSDDEPIEFQDPIGALDKGVERESCSEPEDGFSSDSESSWMDESSSKPRETNNSENTAANKTQENCCKICSKNFHRRCNLTVHMKKQHEVLLCRRCTSTFKTETELKLHMKAEHRKLWCCLHCEQTFERKGLRSNHIKMEHSTKPKKNRSAEETFPVRTIKKSFVCEVCGVDLRTRKKLKIHLRTHAEYTFECKECGKILKTLDGYRRHLQIHGDNYICPRCGKQLSSKATYNKHMLVHSDELKHKCDVCGRAFKRGRALKYHLLAHTGLRPYKCDFCEKTFSTGSSCRLHKKTMHPHELAELEASGVKQYTQNIPNLDELRAVARTGTNFRPLMSKQNGYAPRA